MTTLFPLLAGIFGLLAGSFANVCILRIPAGEGVVLEPSHCTSCNRRLRWFELIPVFSFIALRGHCRTCGSAIRRQYPIVEAACALLWALVAWVISADGWPLVLIGCMAATGLLILSVIDGRTGLIPPGCSIFIALLGVARLAWDWQNWPHYVIGAFAVSLPLLAIYYATGKRGIGGGDVKLMAAAGLLLGWSGALLAFFGGCLAASIIHLVRMKAFGAERSLALGPYLSAGILAAFLWGDTLIHWYLNFL